MKKIIIYISAIVLSLVFVISTIVIINALTYQKLNLNIDNEISITKEGQAVWLKFTPSQSGMYTIKSNSNYDTIGYLYNDLNDLLSYSDDYNGQQDFYINCYLDAYQTYYLKVKIYSGIGKFTVFASLNGIESILISDLYLQEGKNCYEVSDEYNWDESFYYYDTTPNRIKVKYTSGRFETYSYYDFFECTGFELELIDDQYENHWESGNHTVIAHVIGTNVKYEYNVIVKECPIKNIEIKSISLEEGKDCIQYYDEYDWDEEYNYYHNFIPNQIIITYNDGKKLTCSYNSFYEQTDYEIEVFSKQEKEHWKVGKNTAYARIIGINNIYEYTVIIKPTNIASIEIEDLKYIEGKDVPECWEWDEFEPTVYYYYDCVPSKVKVIYKDGSECVYNYNSFMSKTGYQLEIETDQEYVHWMPGKHTATITIRGLRIKCKYNVLIFDQNGNCIHAFDAKILQVKDFEHDEITSYTCQICGYSYDKITAERINRYSKGDINNDYKVNAIDSNLIAQIIIGKFATNIQEYDAADLNDDGKINAIDNERIVALILG